METEQIVTYKYDGKIFNSKEELDTYKLLYISDNKMIQLYKLFYKIPEDEGNYEEAKVPSDATKYEVVIERENNGQHTLFINEWFKTIEDHLYGQPVCKEMINNLVILPNRDFKVGVRKTTDNGGMFIYSQRVYKTYKIIDYLNLMKELKLYLPSTS